MMQMFVDELKLLSDITKGYAGSNWICCTSIIYPCTVTFLVYVVGTWMISMLRSEISLPIMKELVPQYLQENGKERLDYLEDGKTIFKLRLRLCSSFTQLTSAYGIFFLNMMDTLSEQALPGVLNFWRYIGYASFFSLFSCLG
ncbi:hypothetical protein SLA2020_051920 [Shorea laevis]